MQMAVARHRPMIRCISLSDGRLRRRQALRKYEVKGRVRKAMSPRVSYSFRLTVILQNRSGIQHQ